VLWIGGIHGDERQGSAVSDSLAPAILGAGLEGVATVVVIRDLNPDGSAANNRCNANGVDLNRNFPFRHEPDAQAAGNCTTGKHALSEPEAEFLSRVVSEYRPTVIVVAHGRNANYPNSRLVDGDGPADKDRALFQQHSGWIEPVPASYDTKSGTLGRWAGDELGIPVLTLEYDHGMDPQVAWQSTREAILAVVRGN
jgi:protein MpaA